MRSIAFAALLVATAATPALAQDGPNPFTGARVEGQIGWDRIQADGGHKDGVDYGVAAGYDFAAGRNMIVGGEVELSDSSTKQCYGSATALDPRDCLRTGRDIYVGARVGTLVTPRTLLYAKAGYTNARAKFTEDDGSDRYTLARRDLDGVRVGIGTEYAVGPNSYVKAEYRYSNYESGVSRNQVVGGFGFRF
ncbi:outer membrane protein [Flavisphingomonas formosensis]|uniref:outer membrane protein n=1 Tax=Flavisphingomonas formosensis TaxID=861534 RepID=UPI0012FC6152|nr:porin family protein [Sphingomonas formosensis]